MSDLVNQAFESYEEAQAVASRREALALSKIPLKVAELHGQFIFGGYVARSRILKCALCETTRTETLGIFAREDHVAGGQRYTLVNHWPQKDNLRHEIERVEEPFCFACVQELGFTQFEDLGERRYIPQALLVERDLKRSTPRIIPASVGQVLTKFAEKKSSRLDLDVEEMLRELGDGSEQ